MRNFLLIIGLFPIFLCGSSEARRMQAYLLIGDPQAAAKEARQALLSDGENPLILEWSIKSLAAAGADSEMLGVWETFNSLFPQEAQTQDLLEDMCWGILQKGKEVTGTASQLICLIAAALTKDIRAVPFLLDGMRHSNAQIRSVALELATYYGDYPLRAEICCLFQEEKVPDVRVQIIKAIGRLKIESLLPALVECVANPKVTGREKLAAIESIVEMCSCLGKEQIKALATSDRAGLRQLACEVIATCMLTAESDLLIPLMEDVQSAVCAAALKAWGILKKEVTDEIKRLACESQDPHQGIAAAWVWLVDQPDDAEKAMEKWLVHPQAHVRALAASAVADSGAYGIPLAKKILSQTEDPFVQINLAIALARQREEIPLVCSLLEKVLANCPDRWMLSEDGLFQPIEKSTLVHNPAIANYPEVVNQSVRLEILNLLAILESPKALDAIKSFLKQRKWKVTGLAAETLLGEGDESAMDLIRELLQDPDQEIRLEAALVLASWGKDPKACETLLEVYPKSDRHLQLIILESLGRIGDKKSIPFLIKCLQEPSLILRMVAASVLIQTLSQ